MAISCPSSSFPIPVLQILVNIKIHRAVAKLQNPNDRYQIRPTFVHIFPFHRILTEPSTIFFTIDYLKKFTSFKKSIPWKSRK